MSYINNATLIRRDLMSRIAKIAFKSHDLKEIDYIPLEMIPKNTSDTLSGCIYKDRAIIRSRIIALLGLDVQADDEITLLSVQAESALKRGKITDNIFTILNHACAGCITNSYVVTNACQGCIARPCMMNCPKKAITIVHGKALINETLCVNCGICQQSCPYHAITYIPIPCMSVCPVGAIEKDENNLVVINDTKCIHCGQCIRICPFNAIMDKSQILDIIKSLKSAQKTVAILAPAIAGQFSANYKKLIKAIRSLGFDYIVEAAYGADLTSDYESRELIERLAEGDSFMTSSCCPAYVEAGEKHIPEIVKYISHTKSPMYYSAKKANELFPEALTVFIGPCTAKKQEAFKYSEIKYVMTFEELGAMLLAKNIEINNCEEDIPDLQGSVEGRAFAKSGGVSASVLKLNPDMKIDISLINGLNKKSIQGLKLHAKGLIKSQFVEVMTCEGGCIAGPNAVSNIKIAEKYLNLLLES